LHIRVALIDRREMGLLDVREGPFSHGQPLFAVPLSLGRIEPDVLDLMPRLDAPFVSGFAAVSLCRHRATAEREKRRRMTVERGRHAPVLAACA
jgi:hypothetical protein